MSLQKHGRLSIVPGMLTPPEVLPSNYSRKALYLKFIKIPATHNVFSDVADIIIAR